MRDKILVIDDEPNLLKILSALLGRKGYDVFSFTSFDEALPTLNTEDLDVVVTDLSMPGKTGMDVLSYCKQYTPDLPVVMITAFGTVEAAVSALKAGAFDFVMKPFEQEDLFQIIEKAIQSRRRRKREPALEMMSAVGVGPIPIPLFGNQAETQKLRSDVERISSTRSQVLISGEVGTGKRSVAYEIHRKSDRARGPFIQLQCEAIPDVFQVSEIFGVEKGATPLAFVTRPGRLELALGGTLLLDEITALSVEAQNALYNAIETERFSRVGGAKIFPFDLRIIATTSRLSSNSLDERLKSNSFHIGLYQKISVESLLLKPLSDRVQDLETHLIPHFVERACRKKGIPLAALAPQAMDALKNKKWAGNLGELEKKVEQLINLYDPKIHGPKVTLPSEW